jgi:hypothetical protein
MNEYRILVGNVKVDGWKTKTRNKDFVHCIVIMLKALNT